MNKKILHIQKKRTLVKKISPKDLNQTIKSHYGHLGMTNALSRWQLSTSYTSEILQVSLETQLAFSVHGSSLAKRSQYSKVFLKQVWASNILIVTSAKNAWNFVNQYWLWMKFKYRAYTEYHWKYRILFHRQTRRQSSDMLPPCF